jgi:hypothetical protein
MRSMVWAVLALLALLRRRALPLSLLRGATSNLEIPPLSPCLARTGLVGDLSDVLIQSRDRVPGARGLPFNSGSVSSKSAGSQ